MRTIFLPKGKMNIFLECAFFKDFLEKKVGIKRFLENFREFESSFKAEGITETDVKILKILLKILKLRNRYFVMRHGESKANEQGIILSNPREGVPNFGLSDKGKTQTEESALKNKRLIKNVIIYSSDFARARETAEIVKRMSRAKDEVHFTMLLRERHFGNWERTANNNYRNVWLDDEIDPYHKKESVESVMEVLGRAVSLIVELEVKYNGKNILLVSHGDTLQILQTWFMRVPPSKHRHLPHLNLAEIRELK